MSIERLKYYHKSLFDLYIDKSGIVNSGLGVFTKSFIPKNSYIDDYYGVVKEYICGGEYCFEIDKGIYIDAGDIPRCYMAMLNDASYRPTSKRALKKFVQHEYINNCYFETDIINKRVTVCSLFNIKPNSELFISYGSNYWD